MTLCGILYAFHTSPSFFMIRQMVPRFLVMHNSLLDVTDQVPCSRSPWSRSRCGKAMEMPTPFILAVARRAGGWVQHHGSG